MYLKFPISLETRRNIALQTGRVGAATVAPSGFASFRIIIFFLFIYWADFHWLLVFVIDNFLCRFAVSWTWSWEILVGIHAVQLCSSR